MRSIISLISIVCLFAVGCSTSEKAPVPSGKAGVISGQFSNVDAGTKLFLRSFRKGVLVESGDCELKEDGSFELVPNAPLKMGYHQIMISKRRPLVLITDESEPIYISANVPNGKGYLTGANISGSEATSLLATYYDKLIPLQDSLMSVSRMLKQAEAEERGQSESIASSIQTSLKISSPIISVVIGEGGSGGAIALATADRVMMLEHSIYSVISPEGCASILWRSSDYIIKAAENLKLTAQDCLNNKIIDSIVEEIPGGAHRFPDEQAAILKKNLIENLEKLKSTSGAELKKARNKKFLNMTSNI